MRFRHKRTPPGRGAALKFIGHQADERPAYTLSTGIAQPLPPIIDRHIGAEWLWPIAILEAASG